MLLLLQLSTCNRKSKFAHNCVFYFTNTYTLYLNEIEQNVDSEIVRINESAQRQVIGHTDVLRVEH